MVDKDQHTPGSDDERSDVPATGPAADNATGPVPHGDDDDVTVEDILNAEQSADAADADASGSDAGGSDADGLDADGSDSAGAIADDADNPYLEDVRRLTAEYANYRKRTEANAEIEKQRATAAAVSPLLSVLDDIDRAEQHGDLVEGSAFTTIAQKLRGTVERLGVQAFGEKGEPFDPQIHEAIAQVPVPGTEEHTVLDVIERGYRIGDVELRPAKVAVAVGADG